MEEIAEMSPKREVFERTVLLVSAAVLIPLLWWTEHPGLPGVLDIGLRVALSVLIVTLLWLTLLVLRFPKFQAELLVSATVFVVACLPRLYFLTPLLHPGLIRHRTIGLVVMSTLIVLTLWLRRISLRWQQIAVIVASNCLIIADVSLAVMLLQRSVIATSPAQAVSFAGTVLVPGKPESHYWTHANAGRLTTNVRKFGAIGDGQTDDVEAFTAALKAAGPGGVVYVPEGTYLLSHGLTVDSGVELRGTSMQRSILIRQHGGPKEDAIIRNKDGASNVHLIGFTVDANRQRRESQSEIGIAIHGGSGAVVESLTVKHTFLDGIRLDDGAVNGLVRNTLVEDAGAEGTSAHGIMLASPANALTAENTLPSTTLRHRITGNTVRFARNTGILLLNVADIIVDDNIVEDSRLARGINMGATSSHIAVLNNVVERAHSSGIQVAYSSDITVAGNYVHGTVADGSGIGNEGQGIKAYVSVREIRIWGNTSVANATDGIALLPGVSGASISGNVVRENGRDGIRILAGHARVLPIAGISSVSVAGNVIFANRNDGIAILTDQAGMSVTDWTAMNNTITASGGCSLKIPQADSARTMSTNRVGKSGRGDWCAP